jgi:hypothetical protein
MSSRSNVSRRVLMRRAAVLLRVSAQFEASAGEGSRRYAKRFLQMTATQP